MLICRTPLRVSFVGGGTDLPAFYRQSGGAVVSMSINRYFYLSMHKYFGGEKSLLKYSKTELVDRPQDIEHRILREVFTEYDLSGIDFASAADVPAGTGMGSSSAFTVGLLQLVNAWLGRYVPQKALADMACRIEIERLGEPIGKQDQYGAAIGGLKHIRFNTDDTVTVSPIFLDRDQLHRLENSLMLFYTGNQRSASKILSAQNKAIEDEPQTVRRLARMAAQADELHSEIMSNIDAIGSYLHEAWMLKRGLSSAISNPEIDALYDAGIAAGAAGGKLLGAGAGGFLLFYVAPERQDRVREALRPLPEHRLRMDHAGSIIIFDDRKEVADQRDGRP